MTGKSGLVSISFRNHSVEEIAQGVKEAGLEAIEWGGDVHVPHGDAAAAKHARELCAENGIAIPEYGSYYIIGQSEESLFEKVLLSASILKTPAIRVWAGQGISSDTISNESYAAYVRDAQRICDCAPDMLICLECHPGTLTDEYHTALQFLRDVDRENLKMFWQPNQYRNVEYNLDSIRALLPYIYSVHVFSWKRDARFPLDAGLGEWRRYIDLLGGKTVNYMLEFMHDDKLETLAETAQTLKDWLHTFA